ncbi:hypothetical protein KEM60_03079 [Austwickia sp. TVS 96-490-7B]|uniref:DMT family transporter n=1 Tax=Austwickia sp. TVS 96-490-7B TaxID=2830843 RepID=UPI001DB4FA93|nr:DMT family transporter [Austwickia sp. TVS 96-490-7B]MBW3086850.1 hypothetical protein [Austwickia sp. TVS 96-490-7B]
MRTSRSLRTAEFAVLMVAVAWGTSYVAMKNVTSTVETADFIVLRFASAAILLTLLTLPRLRSITRAETLLGLTYGVLLFVILGMETIGVHSSTAANAGFLISLSVILVPMLDRLLFRMRIHKLIIPCLLLALIGTALTSLSGDMQIRSGDLLIMGAALLRALQTVLYARIKQKTPPSPLRITVVQMWTVVLLALIVGGFDLGRLHATVTGISRPTAAWIVYLGVCCTAAAFLVQLWVAPKMSPTTVGLLLATEPIFAGISAISIGNESLSPVQVIGGTLIVVSVLAARAINSVPPEQQPDQNRPPRH